MTESRHPRDDHRLLFALLIATVLGAISGGVIGYWASETSGTAGLLCALPLGFVQGLGWRAVADWAVRR